MSNTVIEAKVEVAYSSIRGQNANTQVVSSDKPGTLEIRESEDRLRLRAEVTCNGVGKQRFEGRAHINLDRENATTLCRNLAAWLGLTLN